MRHDLTINRFHDINSCIIMGDGQSILKLIEVLHLSFESGFPNKQAWVIPESPFQF